MKLKHLVILGVLVFFNGFIFTVLLLMVSREMARPAATPTQLSTATPTVEPTHTVTPPVSTSTSIPLATSTTAPQPTATNTVLVAQPSPTGTPVTSVPTATFTPGEPTATSVPPTATSAPPTATATTQPTATPFPYEFRYAGGVVSAPNCDHVYLEGKITGVGGEPVDGLTVRIRFAGQDRDFKVSGDGKPPGEWGFAPLAPENFHSPFRFEIDVVESQANPEPRSDTAVIEFTDCDVAGQFTNIVFVYAG